MTEDDAPTERSFLRRWSQRKLAASREAAVREPVKADAPAASQAPPSSGGTEAPGEPTSSPVAPAEIALPPVESLTFESDFTAFLRPGVDAGVRSKALRKLFSDPHFNVMDGLDVYIDDYGKTVPIPPDILAQLAHARAVLDPPRTRVNAQGFVEDVPDEPPRADEAGGDRGDDGSRCDDGDRADVAGDPVSVPGTVPAQQSSPDATEAVSRGATTDVPPVAVRQRNDLAGPR
jgi:hypothetical protein